MCISLFASSGVQLFSLFVDLFFYDPKAASARHVAMFGASASSVCNYPFSELCSGLLPFSRAKWETASKRPRRQEERPRMDLPQTALVGVAGYRYRSHRRRDAGHHQSGRRIRPAWQSNACSSAAPTHRFEAPQPWSTVGNCHWRVRHTRWRGGLAHSSRRGGISLHGAACQATNRRHTTSRTRGSTRIWKTAITRDARVHHNNASTKLQIQILSRRIWDVPKHRFLAIIIFALRSRISVTCGAEKTNNPPSTLAHEDHSFKPGARQLKPPEIHHHLHCLSTDFFRMPAPKPHGNPFRNRRH